MRAGAFGVIALSRANLKPVCFLRLHRYRGNIRCWSTIRRDVGYQDLETLRDSNSSCRKPIAFQEEDIIDRGSELDLGLRRGTKYGETICYEEYCSRSPSADKYLQRAWAKRKMKCFLQVLSCPTADTRGTCLLLHFDNKRYLIGHTHEGAQRVVNQHRIGLNKVSDVFLTGKTEWSNLGGLIGLVLSIADSVQGSVTALADAARQSAEKLSAKLNNSSAANSQGKTKHGISRSTSGSEALPQKLTIHGGANVLHTLAAGRKFIFRKGLPIEVREYDSLIRPESRLSEPTWCDENVRVWAIPVYPTHDTDNEPSDPLSRKRSFDDYLGTKSSQDARQDPLLLNREEQQNRLQILRGIVSDMFDSDWRMDALIEKRLGEVRLPSTIFVRDSVTKKIEKYQGPLPSEDPGASDVRVLVRRPWPGSLVAQLPPTSPSPVSMCYLFRNHPQRGKFLPGKAKELKVKPGPDFRKLTQGEPVLAQDGTLVTPDQVLEPTKPGNGFFVADVPSVSYLCNLFALPYWENKEVMEGVRICIWILGTEVSQDYSFQEFLRKNDRFEHVILSTDHQANRLSIDSAAASTIKHHQIDPERYDIPKHSNYKMPIPETLSNTSLGDRGLTIDLEPSFKLDRNTIIEPLDTASVVANTPKDVLELAQIAKKSLSSSDIQQYLSSQELPSPEAEIITLGTGSATPSKYRNVSSTLIRVPGSGSYLFDCGENTLGQLSRMYSSEELAEVMKDLRLIWISHLHADHHLGTASVIKAWHKAAASDHYPHSQPVSETVELFETKNTSIKDPLFIFSERGMIDWLREYSMVENIGFDSLIPLSVHGAKRGDPKSTTFSWAGRTLSFHDPLPEVRQALREATGLEDFAATKVPHCRGAMAVSLTFPTGFKISYSGDCRPSQNFVEIGKGSTVLVHEATFDDELKGDAEAKNHSTTSEAIGVGIAMNARRILLTHFSQRYQKLPSSDSMKKIRLRLEPSSERDEALMTGLDSGLRDPTVLDANWNTNKEFSASDPQSSPRGLKEPETFTAVPKPDTKVSVAFDYMRVKVKDMASLELFNPAFVKLYEEKEKNNNN